MRESLHHHASPGGFPGDPSRIEWAASEGDYTISEPTPFRGRQETNDLFRLASAQADGPNIEKMGMDEPRRSTGRARLTSTLFFPISRRRRGGDSRRVRPGKTMTQHPLAKWSDAEIIVYIGCGERGNEMTEMLTEFPKIEDPRTAGH